MSLKTINIDPGHLKVSNRKSKKFPVLSINQPNLRQLLLNKLMHRKTQKKALVLPVNEGSFDDKLEPEPPFSAPVIQTPVESSPNTDKPYGVLKNGTKPTFKEWTLNNKVSAPVQTVVPVPVIETPVKNYETPLESSERVAERVAVPTFIKKIKVGKNKRTKSVDILIENIHTRKLNNDNLQLLKKTNITTVKNYLKNRQLIKVGSNAPNALIRYMYENIKECGDVINENKSNLIHNFTRDSS